MRLYLSSYRLGNHANKLRELVGDGGRVAVVMNAEDGFGDEERPRFLQREVADLEGLDLVGLELDLRDYFGRQAELATKLREFDGVWISGGNALVLRRAMADSGFDKTITSLVEENSIVYAGYSAAGCVASPTLQGVELVDDPSMVRTTYGQEPVWEGLGLIRYCFAPHYRSDHPESAAVEKLVQFYSAVGIPFKALRDGEVLVADDGRPELH